MRDVGSKTMYYFMIYVLFYILKNKLAILIYNDIIIDISGILVVINITL